MPPASEVNDGAWWLGAALFASACILLCIAFEALWWARRLVIRARAAYVYRDNPYPKRSNKP